MPRSLANPTSLLSDGVVDLRPWTYADVGCVEAASKDPRIPAGTTVPAEYTEAEGRAFIERQWGRCNNGEGLSLAIAETSTGEAFGLIVLLYRANPSVLGLGYWVVPQSRKKGFASRAVSLIVPWALSQPSVAEIEAIVERNNEASLRVMQQAGFARVGNTDIDGREAFRLTRR